MKSHPMNALADACQWKDYFCIIDNVYNCAPMTLRKAYFIETYFLKNTENVIYITQWTETQWIEMKLL